MNTDEAMNLGFLINGYIMATLIVEGYAVDRDVWEKMQSVFLDRLEEETEMPAEDIASLVERLGVDMKSRLRKASDGTN